MPTSSRGKRRWYTTRTTSANVTEPRQGSEARPTHHTESRPQASSCFSARDRRRLSRRCCRGRLRILTFHLQILVFLLFEHDGFYPSLLVVYTPTGGTFSLLLSVGSEFELLQTTSMITGEMELWFNIKTGRRTGDLNHERTYRCTFDLVWLTKASSDS